MQRGGRVARLRFYYCICVLILLYTCVLILLYMQRGCGPFEVLLHMCPHTAMYICLHSTIYVSSYSYCYVYMSA